MRMPKLILVKGSGGQDGRVFTLEKRETVLGRTQGDIVFGEDLLISPRHCTFIKREGQLVVRDDESTNGIFVRLHEPTPLADGQLFWCGEQVFRFERFHPIPPSIGIDGAIFGGSVVTPWVFRVSQVLAGGFTGLAFCARKRVMNIGREDCDINFYQDPYISHHHARLEERDGHVFLSDSGSRNGTFLRYQGEVVLKKGNQIFIGQQLFRIEDLGEG